jgi:hypothetical protein
VKGDLICFEESAALQDLVHKLQDMNRNGIEVGMVVTDERVVIKQV